MTIINIFIKFNKTDKRNKKFVSKSQNNHQIYYQNKNNLFLNNNNLNDRNNNNNYLNNNEISQINRNYNNININNYNFYKSLADNYDGMKYNDNYKVYNYNNFFNLNENNNNKNIDDEKIENIKMMNRRFIIFPSKENF